MTPEQLAYVKQQLARGVSQDQLVTVLRSNGYGEELITQLLASAQADTDSGTATPQQSPAQPQPQTSKKRFGWLKIVLLLVGVLIIGFLLLAFVV